MTDQATAATIAFSMNLNEFGNFPVEIGQAFTFGEAPEIYSVIAIANGRASMQNTPDAANPTHMTWVPGHWQAP